MALALVAGVAAHAQEPGFGGPAPADASPPSVARAVDETNAPSTQLAAGPSSALVPSDEGAARPAPLRAVDDPMGELPPPTMGLGEIAGPLAKSMLMLGVVLLIAYLSLHKGLGKLVERQNMGRRVKVVERIALDQRRSLFLVDVDGKQMLLGAGEGGVVHLRDLDPLAPTDGRASTPSIGQRFADALKLHTVEVPPVTSGMHAPTPPEAASKKA